MGHHFRSKMGTAGVICSGLSVTASASGLVGPEIVIVSDVTTTLEMNWRV